MILDGLGSGLKYNVQFTNAFKRDYRRMERQGKDLQKLHDVITMLANGETLPEVYRDHQLKNYRYGRRECHIAPDWLFVYQIEDENLILVCARTGSHAELKLE